ncbi:hypothetical protein X743_14850 [Mesorhizobium sp. LNHC252B00]|uniref:hypothetical protein n=1 Tax=Mesorhizobium sp. LNHC252B00 TaxID=1287252 RepID=UPI0003CEBCE8|nr:hypothetical protein [Mesorhizobium sp. LNHC252B00]ESY72787.1 hypothetical protein X743_14850 [Mesorhizobium sp. LNHC252B00]
MTDAIPMVEPAIVPDTFITGATPLQFMGDNLRLTLFVAQRSIFDGGQEHLVVSRLVGSRADMLQLAAAIVRGCAEAMPNDTATSMVVGFHEAPKRRH